MVMQCNATQCNVMHGCMDGWMDGWKFNVVYCNVMYGMHVCVYSYECVPRNLHAALQKLGLEGKGNSKAGGM